MLRMAPSPGQGQIHQHSTRVLSDAPVVSGMRQLARQAEMARLLFGSSGCAHRQFRQFRPSLLGCGNHVVSRTATCSRRQHRPHDAHPRHARRLRFPPRRCVPSVLEGSQLIGLWLSCISTRQVAPQCAHGCSRTPATKCSRWLTRPPLSSFARVPPQGREPWLGVCRCAAESPPFESLRG